MSEHIEITPEIIEIRHYLHAHPERSFKEYETSAYIEKLLRAHDIEVLNNPLETGVVGLIRGEKIVVYKYKSKKNYRRKQGHRQPYTKVEITKIG